mmetsp:Transcript_90060/g.243283  ORF Transcript_90060/g.243283 Transcript_90060/m.243283 type:complete len:118 (+) Transcript_90060:1177-1530(+)
MRGRVLVRPKRCSASPMSNLGPSFEELGPCSEREGLATWKGRARQKTTTKTASQLGCSTRHKLVLTVGGCPGDDTMQQSFPCHKEPLYLATPRSMCSRVNVPVEGKVPMHSTANLVL